MTRTATGTISDLDVALAAARAGAQVVRAAFGGPVTRHAKEGTDFATQADLDAERAIRAVLAAARPDDVVVGEELGGPRDGLAPRRWLVDPLCGTLNFAAGTGPFGVNVALQVARAAGFGDSAVAVVVDPVSGDVLWTDGARTGRSRAGAGGAGQPLVPDAASRLVDVDVDGATNVVGPRLVADPVFREQVAVRVSSTSLALAWVAAGQRSAYVTDRDVAGSVHFTPGIALCRAAGCVVTDLTGGPVDTGRGLVAAADAATSRLLLRRVRDVLSD
ncbi:inositol monophosphatase family protein [Isoptericola sp. NEAU-Y5]|uniref:Inositol monophosphatase family protein n=1 Tax=Isoptericola luteus TaxID=2879484 RepID=A0ABS7ZIT0_9MICO|nr:inositol monophosphatase family protein [Isoptericola sp. NEAU-Y5]MCA5893690.1 inositol monophosphatase family protein [Isoptericola sp. NEAU-Y5]